jgi:phosphosulfolactate synthase
MNQDLPHIPERALQPRESGLTMMMDKGLSIREAENFISSSAAYTDLVKFGFGTALISMGLEEKISLYKSAALKPYFGGTLFELFIVRNRFDDFRKMLDRYRIEFAEVSDGSMAIPHDEKLEYIRKLSEQVTVLSEVGSKVAGVEIPDEHWVTMMKAELAAGSWKVIAEARESGTIGIYKKDGSANTNLIDEIVRQLAVEDVLWEAPNKNQQVWFIQLLGANVNLGNIAPNEVVSLESLRLGLRGDTFFNFLPDSFHDKKL